LAAGAKPVRVLDPQETTHLTVVGCGGTGGFVIKNACRLVWGLRERRRAAEDAPLLFGEDLPGGVPEILLCDGDTVERKNLVRQDFVAADVGRPKALVLAERASAAYGLEVRAYPRYVKEATDLKQLAPEGGIVVGCVDNADTRRTLHEKLSSYDDVVYVDAGNAGIELPEDPAALSRTELRKIRESGWSGQVVCGVRKGGETLLPFPADVMPDLIESAGGPEDLVPDEVPCGQVVVSAPQRHATNLWAAALIYDYLQDLLSDGTVLHASSFFDARRKYVKSYPAIDELDQVAV
jgi:hypothetical protein